MNPHQIKRLFPNASASLLKANAGDYGASQPLHDHPTRPELHAPESAQPTPALAVTGKGEAQSPSRPHVCFTLRRTKLLDTDAKWGAVKDLLDGLAYAGLIHGDREDQITLEVRQEKVRHRKEQETVIEVEMP